MSKHAPNVGLSTGQLCRLATTTRGTLRTYEKAQLIAPMERTTAGYRLYAHDCVDRLHMIRSAKAVGLTLAEIRDLLPLLDPEHVAVDDLVALAQAQMQKLNQRINALTAMREVLAHVVRDPSYLMDPNCDIEAALAQKPTAGTSDNTLCDGADHKMPS
jgi:MerR family transcriptional regulator, copper efflux regulator